MYFTDGAGALYSIDLTSGDRAYINWIMDPETDPEIAGIVKQPRRRSSRQHCLHADPRRLSHRDRCRHRRSHVGRRDLTESGRVFHDGTARPRGPDHHGPGRRRAGSGPHGGPQRRRRRVAVDVSTSFRTQASSVTRHGRRISIRLARPACGRPALTIRRPTSSIGARPTRRRSAIRICARATTSSARAWSSSTQPTALSTGTSSTRRMSSGTMTRSEAISSTWLTARPVSATSAATASITRSTPSPVSSSTPRSM